ncbi:MAG TPA: biopolymer transporter ExbD [Planctomycetota bacterium]|nr:biopolymer transporter ExbD [Planctomycetota bacterium]
MAGTQDPNENPVSIQVVPMVDIIFCLCVFFMCSMKFKELEGKFESWLPKNKGQSQPMTMETPIEEIRVALYYNEVDKTTTRKFGATVVRDDIQLQELIRDSYAGWLRLGKPETPAIVDAAEMVPWHEVVRVVNLAKREKIEKIEFAAGRDYEAKK